MYKVHQWLLAASMILIITACGGGGTSSSTDVNTPVTQGTNLSTLGMSAVQKDAIDYIANYAENGGVPPTIQHYEEAGVSGVNADNINNINKSIEGLTYDQVDTLEELQTLADQLGVGLPGNISDTVPPVITLLGSDPQQIIVGNTYIEFGASASDNVDGDISSNINIDVSTVNTGTAGSYTVTYNVSDAAGNTAVEVTRTVDVNVAPPPPVSDTTAPLITLLGANPQTLTVGDNYRELGASASDNVDGDISSNINIDASTVNTATAGSYTVTYNVLDAAGNTAVEVTRTVDVNVAPPPPVSGPNWTFISSVAQGVQFDAQIGPNDRIHLISSHYYQFDISGHVLIDENKGDEQQSLLRFPPAIAVGNDGSVHTVTRDAGDVKTGVNIRYRRRNSAGNWDADYVFGTRVARNYVVGIGWADANNILMSSTNASVDGLYGEIHLWKAGNSSASYLGTSKAIWRADVDSRLRGQTGIINLISGNTANSGAAYFSKASAGTGVLDRLNANMKTHTAGSARRGFPDLAIDIQDNTHFVYGSNSAVYYNKYNENGQKVFSSDKRIFTNLGTWHLNTGLSAIAVSESGSVVVIVALRTKGDQAAADSDLLWSYSTDGGVSWSTPQDTGKNSDGGEGRRRPCLVAVGDKFVLLYGDTQASGISMGVITIP